MNIVCLLSFLAVVQAGESWFGESLDQIFFERPSFEANGTFFERSAAELPAQILAARQSSGTCTLPQPWVACAGGLSCCPAIKPQCCGNGVCCSTDSRCFEGGLCCPNSAVTCGRSDVCVDAGSTCCGTKICPDGIPCVSASGGSKSCCATGYFACDPSGCCPNGSTCAPNNKCASASISETTIRSTRTTTRTSTYLSTSLSTYTTTSLSTSYSYKTYTTTISTDRCPPTNTPKRDSSPAALGRRDTVVDAGDFIVLDIECYPVMGFPCVEGLSDQLCESMCGGIAAEAAKGKGNVLDSRTVILTWRGGRLADPTCKGYCKDQRDAAGDSMECDEFPPASTLEGGPNSHKMCISWKQNKGLQGPLIRSYSAFYGLKAGDKFIIQMSSCGGSRKRSDSSPGSTSLGDGSSLVASRNLQWVKSPLSSGNGSPGYFILPLLDATQGNYTVKLSFSSLNGIQNVAILDGDGIEYWSQSTPFKSNTLDANFGTDDTANLVVAAAASSSVSIAASYSGTLKPSATATPTGGAGRVADMANCGGLILPVLLSVWCLS